MKIVSWNINGINACVRKGMMDFISENDADIYCFQELKASPEKIPEAIHALEGYHKYWHFAEKKGYSGVGFLSKRKPESVIEGIGVEEFDREGRFLALVFEEFVLINTYFPHSSRDLSRMEFKLRFNQKYQQAIKQIRSEFARPLIMTGDFNVAHTEDDIARPKDNVKNAGFTPKERAWFTKFLEEGYVDTFRLFTEGNGHYTWWSYMHNARARNIGWRIDYFAVEKSIEQWVQKSIILPEVLGSDHCPIALTLKP